LRSNQLLIQIACNLGELSTCPAVDVDLKRFLASPRGLETVCTVERERMVSAAGRQPSAILDGIRSMWKRKLAGIMRRPARWLAGGRLREGSCCRSLRRHRSGTTAHRAPGTDDEELEGTRLTDHASILTTERYDSQTLENLQAAAAKLEAGRHSGHRPPQIRRQTFNFLSRRPAQAV
jgi:hypothetical protein